MFIDDKDIHFLSRHQANALLSLSDNNIRQKVLLLIMLDAGLRVSETVNIKLSDFDFKKRLLTVFSLKKKNKTKYRQIPLSNRLFFALSEYIKTMRNVRPDSWLFPSPAKDNEHISRFAVNRYLTRKKKKLNIENLHPHTLRHTFATGLIAEDIPVNEVADLLGHENINTTRIYTHIPNERLRKSIQKASSHNDKSPWWKRLFKRFFSRKLPTIYIPQSGTAAIVGRNSELQQISNHVNKGTNVCLVGPTGTGKKTLLDAISTDKKILTFDDTASIKKSLIYLLVYLYKNNMEAVQSVLFGDFDLDKMESKLSRQTISTLCDEIKKVCSPKEFILKIRSMDNITASAMRTVELLKDHFIIVTGAREIPINKASFLWNFEKIKINNLSRAHAWELIHKLSYDLEIEDYEVYRNHIMEQTDGNPRAIVEMIERYRREPVLVTEVVRSVTHRGPVKEIDFSFVVIFFIASLAVFRYMTSEFDNPGLRVIGGLSMILLLLSRSIFSRTKRRYV
jgi:hypothetical protein